MKRQRLIAVLPALLCLLLSTGAEGQTGSWEDTPGLLEPARNPRRIPATSRQERHADRAQASETLGILIRNPNTRNGEPPFALADQFGRVQRLVEPSIGIDLSRYIGQTVTVRHDTGQTLLASQLGLGPTRLTPLSRPRRDLPPNPASLSSVALAVPGVNDLSTRPVVITQFEEKPATTTLPEPVTPEPIILEEIIGNPAVQPIEGLPLPSSSGLAPAGAPSLSPIDTISKATSGATHSPGCLRPDCGCGNTNSPDVFFEAELLLLRMFNSEPTVTDDDYETGSRFTLGVTTSGGAQWLARYLEYDNDNFDGAGGDLSLDFYNLEYGRTFNLGCRWTGLFTLGGQLTEFRDTAVGVEYSDAIGPAVGVQLRGPRWNSLHPLLGARHSLQFGEASTGAGDAFGSFTTTELAAGIEYQRQTRGSTVFGRAAIESVLIDGAASDGNTSLFGFGLSLGVAR